MLLSVRKFVQSGSGWKYCRLFEVKRCKSSPFCFLMANNHTYVGCVNRISIHFRHRSSLTSGSLVFRPFVTQYCALPSYRQYCSKTDKFDIFIHQNNLENRFDYLNSDPHVLTTAVETDTKVTCDYKYTISSDDAVYQEKVFQNLQILQSFLKCSDEKLASVVKIHPYLNNLEVLENIIEKVKILLQYSFQKKLVYAKLRTLCNCLIYIDSCELSAILDKNLEKIKSRNKKQLNFSSKEIQNYVGAKLAGNKTDNMSYMSELLNVQNMDLLKVTNKTLQKNINRKFRPHLLKSKVDFLVWKGLTKTEIAVNLRVLILPAHILNARLLDMKATLGRVSISVLCKKKSFHSRHRRNKNKIYRVLGHSKKDLSTTAKNFLDDVETSTAYEILDLLMALGVSKEEIKKNVYVLGHKPECVTRAFQGNIGQVDISTSEGQRLLLNLMIYDLEYGNNSEV